jgi:cation diffusion facilitator CzcD-associated flavoprotein CzcO
MGIQLRQAGIDTFTIFEKSDGVGGTWRDNTYPGAACDVPSHLYSFSFAPKVDWTRKYSPQPEILGYFESLVDDFDLGPHLRTGHEVTALVWQRDHWDVSVRDADGVERVARAGGGPGRHGGRDGRCRLLDLDVAARFAPHGRQQFTGAAFHLSSPKEASCP